MVVPVPSSNAATKVLRIGMIGAGTVGGGVYELVQKYFPNRMIITKICVQSLTKERTFTVDPTITTFTTDASELYNNSRTNNKSNGIDCIVEVMGGTTLAKTVVMNSIQNGIHVVTANKALLAECLDEIRSSTIQNKVTLGYEASVCGGIPIINTLCTVYACDTITSIMGICNGTTNYMLSEMYTNGTSYHDVLAVAQQLGFAETDPTADVEGHDVRSKLAILARLAYGTTVANPQTDIHCTGITNVSNVDIQYAKKHNYTIKLLGVATKNEESSGNVVSIYVTPTLVPLSHMLASINGSGNCVAVQSQNMNLCTYSGPGAGRYPTANSIVSDLARLYNNHNTNSELAVVDPFPIKQSATTSCSNIIYESNYKSTSFYIRIQLSNKAVQSSVIKDICIKNGQNFHLELTFQPSEEDSILYLTTKAATTSPIPVSVIEQWSKQTKDGVQASTTLDANIFFMPILD